MSEDTIAIVASNLANLVHNNLTHKFKRDVRIDDFKPDSEDIQEATEVAIRLFSELKYDLESLPESQ